MLMTNAATYKKVVEEYTLPNEKKRARAAKQKADAAKNPKSRAGDLEAFLAGQGAVYAGVGWQMQWEGEKFGGNVLLPNINKGKNTKNAAAQGADGVSANELAAKLNDVAAEAEGGGEGAPPEHADGGRPRTAGSRRSGGGSRPLTAGSQGAGSRPRSRPKTPNLEADKVKVNHDILTSQQPGAGSRPQSAGRVVPAPAMPHRQKGAPGEEAAKRGRGAARGAAAGKGVSPPKKTGGKKVGMDPNLLKQLSDELQSVKASEATMRSRIKGKDDAIFELQRENVRLQEELSAVKSRHDKAQESIDKAMESNRRFDDVQKLLQQNELERIRLIDRVEVLTEENRSWRPVQRKMEGRIEQLLEELLRLEAETARLGKVDELYKLEKDKVAAGLAQTQSWQDIATDLQSQLGRWDEVRLTMERTQKNLESEVARLEQNHNALVTDNDKLRDLLEDHHIEIPDDDESALVVQGGGSDSEPEEALPRTTAKTSGLLSGRVSELVAANEDLTVDDMQPILQTVLIETLGGDDEPSTP